MIKCGYDSGSMTGNRPLCDRASVADITYDVPCYGQFVAHVCERHKDATLGRIYPYSYSVTLTSQPW